MPIQGGTVRWIIEADDSQFNKTADNVEKKAEELTSKLSKKKSSNFWSNLIGDTKGATSALKGIGSSLGSIGWGTFQAGATGAVGALTSLINKGIQATDFLETSRTAMAGLTGSIEAGNKAMSIAANYWQNNPFQRIDVTNATKQLVQFGRTTSQIGDDLNILGNVSLSTGADISELARYYARVSASGRAMTEDLEMMSDRGIPIYRELAKQLNTSQQGVREMASEGKINFGIFRKAMESAVNPEAMKSFENTLSRQTDRLKGSIQILAGQLAGYKIVNDQLVISENGLEKAWTRLLKTLATELRSDNMKQALESIGNALAQIIDKIVKFVPIVMGGLSKAIAFIGNNSATLIPILGGVLALMGKIGAGLPVIGPVIQGLGKNVNGLATSFLKLFKASPLLATFLAIFTSGIIPALKNSEEFRNAIKSLLTSVGKLAQSVGTVFKNIMTVITAVISSEAVTSILTVFAEILARIAEVIASFPAEILTSIVSAFLMFNLLKASPITGYTVAIIAFISVFKKFGPQITSSLSNAFNAVKEWFANVGKGFAQAAKNLATAGHNLMIGLANGIGEGAKKVYQFVQQVASNIVNNFKKFMGIHSPSTVMAEQGKYITLGLAEGITDNKSVVQKAMDSLATDILNTIEKVVDNKADFGLLDYSGQYKEWKKISKMFTAGSQQYQYAIQKMEESRKNANLQILSLQKEYNDALDSTINKISTAYGLFDNVDTTGGKSADTIISDLDKQVAMLQNYASSQDIIAGLNIDEGLKEELLNMGVDATKELAAIAGMTSDQLGKLNDLWVQKQAQANRAAITEMSSLKDETLNKVAEIKSGIDGETVSLSDSGGRLIESISEGVYGAMPTLQSAFSQMDDYIAKAARELSKGTGADTLNDVGTELPADLSAGIDENKSEIQLSADELGNSLLSSLGGIVAGIVAFQFGPKILKALGGTSLGGKVAGIFGNLFGKKGKAVEEATKAVTQSQTLASSTTNITNNVTQMGTGMSKASSIISTITKGALAVVAIAGAIAAMAVALRVAYEALSGVNLGELLIQMGTLSLVLAVTATIMGVIGNFAKYVALGAIVTAVVSGGLLICALALAETSKHIGEIDYAQILAFEGILTLVSGIMALISLFGTYAAIGSIASAIVSGGLLLCALALAQVSAIVPSINYDNIVSLSVTLGVVDAILALISGLAIFASIGSTLNAVITGGLLICAIQLAKASKYAKKISQSGIDNLNGAIVKVDAVLSLISLLAPFATIGSLVSSVIVGGVKYAAEQLLIASAIAVNLNQKGVEKLQEMLTTIASWNTGDLFKNLSNLMNSGLLSQIASNVRSVIENISGLKPVSTAVVDSLKQNITSLSEMKIEGSGLFENKGGAAQELVSIVRSVVEITEMLNGAKQVDYGKVETFVASIKLFDRIDDNAKNGIKRLKDLGDAVSNLDWIKKIFGDVPEDIWGRAKNLVDSVKLFDRIDNAARDGALKFKDMGDALGNIDWIKHIFGDVPEDLPNRAGYIVDAIKKVSAIQLNEDEVTQALAIVAGLLNKIKSTIEGTYETMKQTGNTLAAKIGEGIKSRFEDIRNIGNNLAVFFIGGIADKKSELSQAGADMQGAIWNAIEPKLKDEYYQGKALAQKFEEGIKSVSLTQSGKNAVQGFIDGASGVGTMNNVYKAGKRVAETFLDGLRKTAGEHSPWATTKQSGIYAGEGLAEGIAQSSRMIYGEATSLVENVVDILSMDDTSINPEFSPSVGVSRIPLMDSEFGLSSGRAVEIHQTNNNYSNYSMQKINDDLRWELSKI